MSAEHEDRTVRWVTLAMTALATVALELALAGPERSHTACVVTTLGMLVAPAAGLAWFLDRRTRHVRGGVPDSSDAGGGWDPLARQPRGAVPLPPSPLRGGGLGWGGEAPSTAGPPPTLTLPHKGGGNRIGPAGSGMRTVPLLSLLLVFALPFLNEGVRVALWGRGVMPEVVLLAALRNLGLGLAVLAYRPSCARLSALTSLFLTLIAASLDEGGHVLVLGGLYAVAGTAWLMLGYWNGVAFVAGASGTGARPLPWSAAAWVVGVVAALLVAAAFGPTRAATALAGLVPTSGGTDWNDPESRGGVNDGDDEVSGSEDPRSVGFTQSEIYLESDRPSLYDAFNERYGEPYKPKKMERMIALGSDNVREQREAPVENLRAGRELPLVRRKPEPPTRRPGDREAKALVYVKGPTPLHLRLTSYDRFDGRSWKEEPPCHHDCPLAKEGRGPWLVLERPFRPIYTGTASHAIKVGTLDSSALPIPAHVFRFRVGSVDRPDFFGWAQEGILRMADRTVPAGTVIETEARVVDPRLLDEVEMPRIRRRAGGRYSGFCDGYRLDPAVLALGESWVSGLPEGWPQVAAVVEALRGGYVLDRGASPSLDGADPVADFLLRSRRGPDYQFASAAAVLLRVLGYPARLVSGFYAAPGRYDARTRHTPVLREDVHVWAEVLPPGGTWVAVEPTPGYRIPGPSPTLGERIAGALAEAWRWARRHRLALGAGLVGLAAALRFRLEALDRLATLSWWLSSRAPWRRRVLATLALVERRSRWAGRPRPLGQTPARWYGPLSSATAGDLRDDMDHLVRLADWALYAPDDLALAPSWGEREIRTTCRRVVRGWTLGRVRSSAIAEPR